MADQNLGDAVLTLKTDNSGVKAGMDDAKAIAEKGVADIGASFAKAGAALSVTLTAPIIAGFATAFDNFEESATGIAKVEAGLASTGSAAGKTLEELQRMASGLQEITRFGDDEIMNDVTAQLLTFTKITGDAFDEAQIAVLNLSAKLDQDLKSSAIQVGKALNDPIAGVTALGRVGVKFTEDQKALIEQLVKTGDVAGAQKVILNELAVEFGGTAEAMANVGKGPLIQLQNTLGDVTESFGKVIAEGLIPIIPYVRDFAAWIDGLDASTKTWIVGIAAAAAAIGPLLIGLGGLMMAVQPLVGILGAGGMAGALGALGTAATGPIGLTIIALTALGVAFFKARDMVNDYGEAVRVAADKSVSAEEKLLGLKKSLLEMQESGVGVGKNLDTVNQRLAELEVESLAAAKGIKLTGSEVSTVAAMYLKAQNQIGGTTKTLEEFIGGMNKTPEPVNRVGEAVKKAKEKVQEFAQSWVDFSRQDREREQALQTVIDLVGKEFADAIRNESLPALREIGAQLAYLKDRDAKEFAETFKNDIPPAIQKTVDTFDKGTTEMVQGAANLGTALDKWNGQTKDATDAFGRLRSGSMAELQKMVSQAEQDFEAINRSGIATPENITEAWARQLEAQKALLKAQGSDLSAQEQQVLDDILASQKDHTDKSKGVFEEWSRQVSTVFSDFGKSVSDAFLGLFDGSRGKFNDELRQQQDDLRASLADRTAAFEDFTWEAERDFAKFTDKLMAKQSDQIDDLVSKLKDGQQKLADFEEGRLKRIDEILNREKQSAEDATKKLQIEIQQRERDLRQFEIDKRDEFRLDRISKERKLEEDIARIRERGSADAEQQIARLKTSHANWLKDEEAELALSLSQRTREFGDWVSDAEIELKRKTEIERREAAEAVLVERQAIEDRRLEYATFASKTQADIESVKLATTTALAEEDAAVKASVEAKRSELIKFQADTKADIAELDTKFRTMWGDLGSAATTVLTEMGSAVSRLVTEKLIGMLFKELGNLAKTILPGVSSAFSSAFGNIPGLGGGGGGGGIPGIGGGGAKPPSGLGGGGSSPIGGFDPITFGANLVTFGLNYGKQSEIETSLDDIEKATRYSEIHLENILNAAHTYLAENEWQRHGEIKERLDDIVENTAGGGGGGVTIQINGPVYGYSSVAALIADINSVVRNDGVALTASELLA